MLKLSGLSFAEQGVSAFRSYLCNDTWLRDLQLEHIELDRRDMQEVIAGLRSSKSLRVLSLEYCLQSARLAGHLSECGVLIGELLRDNGHLNYLALDSNELTNEVLEGLASGLRVNRSLNTLSLRNNRIADVAEIAHALRQNTSLTSLDLRDNMISGSAMWSDALVDRPTPLELNLTNCPLRDDALVDLGLALGRQGLLTKLQVGYVSYESPGNLFTGEGIATFLRCLQANVHLKYSEIFPDTWDVVAIDALMEILPCCVSLRSLITRALWSDGETVREVRFLGSLKQNKSLFRVNVCKWMWLPHKKKFYVLRNRVDYALGACSTAICPLLLERLLKSRDDSVEFSVVMHMFKTNPTIRDSMRRGITRQSPKCKHRGDSHKPVSRARNVKCVSGLA